MDQILDNLAHEFHTPFTNQVLIFALILFIILLVPIFFNRFKIPGIIGLILSGTIIGPHGLNLIQRTAAVDLFSTIGLLYIMFIAGLELDLGEFKKHRNRSIVFGILTFMIPITIGFLVFYFIVGYPISTAILIASMLATHTLIAYPIVTRLGISKNQAVAVAVGGTILTDTAVLIILAIITGAVEGGLTYSLWTRLGISFTIFALIVVFVVPRVSSWFFARLQDEKSAHFIFVLSAVFFCAFLADLAGLEPIIGAFAAGLTLNRLIPHTSSLMNRIEFVGNALFIPFFLISVGMIVNLGILTSSPEAIGIALTLATISIIAKGSAARLTGTLFKYSKAESNLLYGLSGSHAAATLAIILVGYNIGLVDDNVLNGTVILILISCVVASFVAEKAGKKLLIQIDSEPEPVVSQQQILVPIANPETMEKLIDLATAMKQAKDRSPIIGLTVVKDNEQVQQKLLHSKKLLEKAIVHAAAADQKIEIMATIDRNVTTGIKRIIKEKFVTDLVLGWSEDKSIADIIFGKTFDSLVKQTTQTLFITRFSTALNIHKKVIIICPVFAEKEPGFYRWLQSILNTALHLRMTMVLYCTEDVKVDISEYIRSNRFGLDTVYKENIDFANIMSLTSQVSADDMLVFICSRAGGISYTPTLDILPRKMAKAFNRNNLLFIYPATGAETEISNYEQEITGGMLEKSISVFKNAKKLFRRD